MIEISCEIEIPAPPAKVWAALVDFAAYAEWNPYQTVAGEAKFGALLAIVNRRLGNPDIVDKGRGAITAFDPPSRLEYRSGPPFIWHAKRWFFLEATAGGTFFRHGMTFTGLAANLAFRSKYRIERLRPYYEAFQKALSRRVQGLAPLKPKASGNRHARRANAAKQKRSA